MNNYLCNNDNLYFILMLIGKTVPKKVNSGKMAAAATKAESILLSPLELLPVALLAVNGN